MAKSMFCPGECSCAFEKERVSDAGWNIRMSLRSEWFIVFRFTVSLLIFCQVLSIIESGILKFPAVFVELFLPSVLSVFPLHVWALLLYVYLFVVVILSCWIDLFINVYRSYLIYDGIFISVNPLQIENILN